MEQEEDMAFYSRRHYERLSNGGPDGPEDEERRRRLRQIGQQAHRETLEKFGCNAFLERPGEAIAWQDTRLKELLKEEP